MTNHPRVDVLSMGTMPLPGPEVFWMSDWDTWFEATFWMVVVRSGEHTIVINTGPPAELGELNSMWKGFHPSGRSQYSRTPQQEPRAALAMLGIEPEDVTHVVLTPVVAYTVGNLEMFANARIAISRRGWIEDVLAPPYPPHVPREIFVPDDTLQYLLFTARDRLDLVRDGDTIVPGVSVWESLVHHRSSLSVDIETSDGRVSVTDSAFAYRNVEQNVHLGIGESYSEAMSTYDRLRRESDIVIPLYEPEVADRHPGGHVAGQEE